MDSKLDDLPVWVPESRIDLLTNNTSDSLIRNRMRAAYFDTKSCVGYATNGHILLRVPLLERPEIELHGDEEWQGWQSQFDDDATVLWAGVCYQPRYLAQTVLAAADLQSTDEVTVYPQEEITYPDEISEPVVAGVGDIMVAIMPFAVRPSIHDIYRVEGSTEALNQPIPSSLQPA